MSDTPISDAARMREKNGCVTTFQGVEIVPAELARQLERDLAEANARLDWILSASGEQLNSLDQWDRDNIDDEINREESK